MVYKNLYNRIFFSFLFFIIYFIAINNNFLLFLLVTFIYLLIYYEVFQFFKTYFRLILLYLFISYLCFTFYFFIFFDYIKFNILVLIIILFDTFSYITGKVIGKNYIFKYISPKKTLEGYLGGFFFTNFFLFISFFIINIEIKLFVMIILINLTIFSSIIGDLIESYFKRKNNIKDTSKYIPGHGGFFDRFDSFIASIIMLTLFSFF